MATKKKAAPPKKFGGKDKGKVAKVAKGRESAGKKSPSPADATPTGLTAEEAAKANQLLALLETGFLVVAANGELDEATFENLGQNFANFTGELTSEELHGMLQTFYRYLDEDGLEGRLAFISGILDDEAKRLAFTFAAGLAMVDGDASDDQMDVLGDLATAFGIPDEEAEATFRIIADQLDEP